MELQAVSNEDAISNLQKIDHIVVLMLENRSFDHMLGYLSLEKGRDDIDGLRRGMSNMWNGKEYTVHRMANPRFPVKEDPCHEARCVGEQLSDDNGGFVRCFAETFPNTADPGLVMGYYFADALPVYDQFASEFLVCDRWFAPVAGQTWPNRLYALAGTAGGIKDNKKIDDIEVPLYDLRTFPQVLDEHAVSWKWYCHDVATLRLADANYRIGHDDNFAYWPDFLVDASNGNLPSVTWIDPLFAVYGGESHDDHPPSTIEAGQILAFKIYAALCNSPVWDRTLFVVTYDEHGGLFDHVAPVTVDDDNPAFRSTGVRVPALVVSPWVEKSAVSHLQYDHTSIIRTILQRFCTVDDQVPSLTARTDNANHLGQVLTRNTPRPAPQIHYFNHLAITLANRLSDHVTADLVTHAVGAVPDIIPKSDLQVGLLKAQENIVRQGHPLGKP